jgi:hypothetical protein
LAIDRTNIEVLPDASGAQKNGPQSVGRLKGGLTAKIHAIEASISVFLLFSLSPANTDFKV